MKNFSIILSTIAVILAVVATVAAYKAKPVATSASVSEKQIAAILKNNPQMVVDALETFQEQQRIAQEKALEEAMAKYAGEINDEGNLPFIGPKDAKVTVVEFFDFSCGYCKRLAPTIEKIIAGNADVKFIFKPLSFVSPKVSEYQAQAGLAAFKQGKFAEFYKKVMANQGAMSVEAVDELAKSLGLDMDKYAADIKSEEVSSALDSVAALSQKIQVHGVPTVFINGKQVHAFNPEEFQDAINKAK